MKHVLVPTDFSAEAHHAFEVALQLARRTGGQLTLLHVVDLPESARFATTGGLMGGGGLNDVYTLKLLQVVKHRMQQLRAEAHRLAPEVPLLDVVRTLEFEAAVLDVVAEQQVDLVVMGAHDHHSWTHYFVDSHTECVVRRSPCPVLTVKHPSPQFEVRHIVFASDFTSEADQAVPSLRQLLAAFPEALLHLLDVVPTEQEQPRALANIHDFARRHALTNYEPDVFLAPQASTGIPRFAEQAHADLVVMLTHGRSGLSHLLQGSISESVALHAAPPVLTLQPH